jgi:hypothetical protein
MTFANERITGIERMVMGQPLTPETLEHPGIRPFLGKAMLQPTSAAGTFLSPALSEHPLSLE